MSRTGVRDSRLRARTLGAGGGPGHYGGSYSRPNLVGAGFLTVPVLTGSAAYRVAKALPWRAGLDEKLAPVRLFYGVIAASALIAVGANHPHINPSRRSSGPRSSTGCCRPRSPAQRVACGAHLGRCRTHRISLAA